ncbi:tRNA uridine-5-carboxymethylaminomethyl(34) synthesis GTPase MnmE [Thermodesulfatator autotrophicus]|uniref:tRNA modification GTPase MnmE n=1 Tax=Thermodesulfatator autotrophicus TaxID=1795632 RepID=A0A177E8S2_9BACT|nr:tRNA uridine-5-carboxymethylaminomethyl(34) synthesis GTPase MnmE [Thermodesulfatator autotrophicus]OAG27612.1 tRNA modification GTPase TrmE [Thermodesulfatator autotrophicus]
MKPKDLEYTEATIAAIATPVGPGAIGVIKVSGSLSEHILKRLFRPKKPVKEFQSHRLYYGYIVNPETETPVDEVLVTLMRNPHTYTREDVLEIYGHSGYLVLTKILELVLKEGARLAEPGEFTKRAFLNGRIDLSQAEALLDLINARSEESLKLALNQLRGALAEKLKPVREAVLSALAVVEVAVDFPDEDVELISHYDLAENLEKQAIIPLRELLKSYQEGRLYREGIAVVIAGRPNVGKSSLLNALLAEERAIVTPIPGTTRDIIEEFATIKGLPVRLIDTAGLRKTEDIVEEIGVKKAKEKIATADVILFMLDGSQEPTEEDLKLYQEIKALPHLVVINKIDIASDENLSRYRETFPHEKLIFISARTGEGLEALAEAIFELVTGRSEEFVPAVVPNLRQKMALEKALVSVEQAVSGLKKANVYPELVAIDLRDALASLGEITGETTTEDLLDRIFSSFCLGK